MSENLSAAEIFRRYNAAENRHDGDQTSRLVAPDLYAEINGIPGVTSAEADAAAMDELYACYPDYRREILEIIDAGDRATVLWRMLGTPAPSMQEDLRSLDVKGVSVVTSDGRVLTRASLFTDSAALSQVMERIKNVRHNSWHA